MNGPPEPVPLVPRREQLFNEFNRLSELCHETLDLGVGIAAGNAYRAYVDEVTKPEQHGELVNFPNRGAQP